MSNKLLVKIMSILVILICICLIMYTFIKNEDKNNFNELQENNNSLDNENDNPVNNDESQKNENDKPNINNGEDSSAMENKKIVIEDRTKDGYCAQAIEYFFEDAEYRYYFSCIKSNNMYVIIDDIEYKLVYALKNNIVTIKELEDRGYKFLKESKNLQSE